MHHPGIGRPRPHGPPSTVPAPPHAPEPPHPAGGAHAAGILPPRPRWPGNDIAVAATAAVAVNRQVHVDVLHAPGLRMVLPMSGGVRTEYTRRHAAAVTRVLADSTARTMLAQLHAMAARLQPGQPPLLERDAVSIVNDQSALLMALDVEESVLAAAYPDWPLATVSTLAEALAGTKRWRAATDRLVAAVAALTAELDGGAASSVVTQTGSTPGIRTGSPATTAARGGAKLRLLMDAVTAAVDAVSGAPAPRTVIVSDDDEVVEARRVTCLQEAATLLWRAVTPRASALLSASETLTLRHINVQSLGHGGTASSEAIPLALRSVPAGVLSHGPRAHFERIAHAEALRTAAENLMRVDSLIRYILRTSSARGGPGLFAATSGALFEEAHVAGVAKLPTVNWVTRLSACLASSISAASIDYTSPRDAALATAPEAAVINTDACWRPLYEILSSEAVEAISSEMPTPSDVPSVSLPADRTSSPRRTLAHSLAAVAQDASSLTLNDNDDIAPTSSVVSTAESRSESMRNVSATLMEVAGLVRAGRSEDAVALISQFRQAGELNHGLDSSPAGSGSDTAWTPSIDGCSKRPSLNLGNIVLLDSADQAAERTNVLDLPLSRGDHTVTLMRLAASAGDALVVDALLRHGSVAAVTYSDGSTPLHAAATAAVRSPGGLVALRALVNALYREHPHDAGVWISAVDGSGRTPAHCAAGAAYVHARGSIDAVEALLLPPPPLRALLGMHASSVRDHMGYSPTKLLVVSLPSTLRRWPVALGSVMDVRAQGAATKGSPQHINGGGKSVRSDFELTQFCGSFEFADIALHVSTRDDMSGSVLPVMSASDSDDPPVTAIVPAHRMVLAAASRFFDAALNSNDEVRWPLRKMLRVPQQISASGAPASSLARQLRSPLLTPLEGGTPSIAVEEPTHTLPVIDLTGTHPSTLRVWLWWAYGGSLDDTRALTPGDVSGALDVLSFASRILSEGARHATEMWLLRHVLAAQGGAEVAPALLRHALALSADAAPALRAAAAQAVLATWPESASIDEAGVVVVRNDMQLLADALAEVRALMPFEGSRAVG